MGRPLAAALTVLVGAVVALQPPVNSVLGRHTGVLGAAFVSTTISCVVLGTLVVVSSGVSGLRGALHVDAIYLTGGLMGAALVSVSLLTVRTLGAGGVVAATVLGQLTVSAALDRAGALGLERSPLTATKLLGIALLLAGTLLVTRR